MLAERNRTGPALAANPATFPLNDVSFASSGIVAPALCKLVMFRILVQRTHASLDPHGETGMVELDGIEPTT
jgi:hypothetical protein